MIGLRQPNKLPYVSKGGLWDSSLRNIVRGLRRWLKKGRQRLTRIALGLLGIVDGADYAGACLKEMGSRPLTQSVKKSKREILRRLVPLRSLRTKKEVEMEDLTPPDHHGLPSHRRAPRQSR